MSVAIWTRLFISHLGHYFDSVHPLLLGHLLDVGDDLLLLLPVPLLHSHVERPLVLLELLPRRHASAKQRLIVKFIVCGKI